MSAIGAVVSMVAHHKVIALRYDLLPVVFVALKSLRHVVVSYRHVVHENKSVLNSESIALFSDHSFHERLVGIDGVIEHDDVATSRLAKSVDEFIDNQSVLIDQRWRHALAFDACYLETESHD